MLHSRNFLAMLLSLLLLGSSMASAMPAVLAEDNTPIMDCHFSAGNEGWSLGTNNTVDGTEGAAEAGCIKIGGAFSIRRDKGGFEDDALYRFSGKFKGSGEMVIRTEFYESIEGGFSGPLGATGSDPFALTNEWQEFSYTFRPLAGATAAAVFIQGKDAGVKYVDDIVLQKEKYVVSDFEPEHVFYYTEFETGRLFLTPNTERYPALLGGKVVFSVTGTGYSVQKPINNTETIESTFSIEDVLSEKGREYTSVAKVYDKNGALVDTKEEIIHRYDRPSFMRADGIFEKNGHTVDPVLMTGLSHTTDLRDVAALGSTIATAYANVTNDRLNYIGNIKGDGTGAEDPDGAPDMYVGVALYSNNQPAGHAVNIENTKARVTDLKANANLFGYLIGEETFSHCSPQTAKELLRISYKTIRDIDPHHPIYFVEITECMYKEAVKYCDIFFPDIYPGNKSAKGEYLAKLTEKAVQLGQRSRKPVYVLHQAYNYNGWMPTGAELRNGIYRSFLEGAKGYGYFTYEKSKGTTLLKDTEMGTMLKEFSTGEQKLLFDLFLRGEKKGEGESEGAVWQAISYGGKQYLIVANRSMETANTASLVITPGASFTKKFGAGTVAENHDGFVQITLSPSAVAVYEVTVPEGDAFIAETPTLKNGDMETVSPYSTAYPENWERVAANSPPLGNLFSMSDAAEAHSGTACAKIGGIVGNPYVFKLTPYTHGEKYEISFYFKYKEAAQKGVPRIEVRKSIWGDVILDGVTGVTYANTIPGINAETWVKCTYHFTAPAEGEDPLAICLFGNANTVCCYDDVVLRPVESEGIRLLTDIGETHTKTDERPAAALGWYFPENASAGKVWFFEADYQMENNAKLLSDIKMSEKETSGKAVTLKIGLSAKPGETTKVLLWKNGISPILKKEITE